MKKAPVLLLIILFLFLAFKTFFQSAPASVPDSEADLILYWGIGCPHCEVVKDYITQNKLDAKFKISQKEVYYNQDNQKSLEATVKLCPEIDTGQGIGVPLAFDVKNQLCLLGDEPIIEWLKK